MVSGNIDWVLAVNIVIWTGLFLYLLRLERQVRSKAADRRPETSGGDDSRAQAAISAEPASTQTSQGSS